jgi:hypothetical protein
MSGDAHSALSKKSWKLSVERFKIIVKRVEEHAVKLAIE